MNEIRKLLGNEYHLCEIEGLDEYEWALYKKYDDPNIYCSDDNKVIMSSDNNSINELYVFAKKQHKIDESRFMTSFCIFIEWMIFVLILINKIFLHAEALRWFLVGINFTIALYYIISCIVWKINFKAKMYTKSFLEKKRWK